MLKQKIITFSSLNADFHNKILRNTYFDRSCSLLSANVKKSMTKFEFSPSFRSKIFL